MRVLSSWVRAWFLPACVRSNNIVDGKGGGIVLHESCGGVFEKNQVLVRSERVAAAR